MMAAVVVIPSTSIPDASAARKRRREILASQRQSLDAANTAAHDSAAVVTSLTSVSDGEEAPPRKARRISDFSEKVTNCSAVTIGESASKTKAASKRKVSTKKKPQMKYDPDVPMTKEEAAIWRREQRRKRNRESAALSRQRQRDRIGDLEIEVGEWKTKVESIMERIKKLEETSGIDSLQLVPAPLPKQEEHVAEQSIEFEVIGDDTKESKFVSPPSSPGHDPGSLVEASPVASSAKTVVDAVVDQVLMGIESYEQEFSNNMISRHATS